MRSGEWRLLQEVAPLTLRILDSMWTGQGTLVLWRHLHRFDLPGITARMTRAKTHFYEEIRTGSSRISAWCSADSWMASG